MQKRSPPGCWLLTEKKSDFTLRLLINYRKTILGGVLSIFCLKIIKNNKCSQ